MSATPPPHLPTHLLKTLSITLLSLAMLMPCLAQRELAMPADVQLAAEDEVAVETIAPDPPATSKDSANVISFFNGDQLPGTISALTPQAVTWASHMLASPAEFAIEDNVLGIDLPASSLPTDGSSTATATLTNGDVLHGKLLACDDQAIAIDTSFAGTIPLNPLMVRSLALAPERKILYAGPGNISEWTQDEDYWTCTRQALVTSEPSAIARPNTLGKTCSVSFDIAWQADALQCGIHFYTSPKADSTPSDGYSLRIAQTFISLINNQRHNIVGSKNFHNQALMTKDQIHVELRCNKENGRFWLLIDGQTVDVWTDPEPQKAFAGDTLQFVSMNSRPLRFSNIIVTEWDGDTSHATPAVQNMQPWAADGQAAEIQKPDEEETQKTSLANGDSIEGTITAIHEGLAVFSTSLGDVRVPVERLRSLPMPLANREVAIRRAGDVRGILPNGSSIVFRLLSADPQGAITGDSQNFGTITFKPDTFSRIEFNIHSPQARKRLKSDTW